MVCQIYKSSLLKMDLSHNQQKRNPPTNQQQQLSSKIKQIRLPKSLRYTPPSLSFKRQESCSSSETSVANDGDAGEDYHFVEESHSVQVLTGLNHNRLAARFCDVTLCVEEEEFPCHRIVLASFSPYFKAMFSSELAESRQERVALNGVEAEMIKQLIEYAYTSEITITKSTVQALLSAANLLEILPVRDACCDFMLKNMDITNCLGINIFAESHACFDMQERAKNFALRYFPEVSQQDEFVHLPAIKLIELIESDHLEVDSEETVFNAVVMWYKYNLERSEGFDKILENVRLPLLSPYFLYDQVDTLLAIRTCSRCKELVEEAKTYHLLPDRRTELRSPRTRFRKSSGIAEVIVAVGGEDDKVVLRSVESFDPQTLQWRTLACLPFAISKHGLVVSGNNALYMAGGEFPDGSASRNMFKYDPVLDQWQEMASMNMPRSELGLALLDGYIYAVGGWEGSYRIDSVERYDLKTNTWTFVSPMQLALTSPAVVANRGRLYVTGGAILEDGDGIEMVQKYNPKLDKWTEVASMLIARSGAAACALNNLIYVIGGWHASTENTNKVECYSTFKYIISRR
ncbi:hypothetical protein CHUAL_014049 [Chamberlinius hualienensis]